MSLNKNKMVAITRSKTLNNIRIAYNKRTNNVNFVNTIPMKTVSDSTSKFCVKSSNSKTNMVFMVVRRYIESINKQKTKDERKKECIKMFTFIKNNWVYIKNRRKFCDTVKNKIIDFYYNQEFEEIEMFFEFFKIKKV